MPSKFNIQPHQIPKSPLVRGKGNVWPISGFIEGDLENIISIKIGVNGKLSSLDEVFQIKHEIDNIDFFGIPLVPDVFHFWHFIASDRHAGDQYDISIHITTKDEQLVLPFSTCQVVDNIPIEPDLFPTAKVAICMATYNPNVALFKIQFNSILQQTEKSWQLIINDDGSDPDIFNQIQNHIEAFDNVHIFQNRDNLGFYYNFEKCLNRIHHQFEYIALADQDDYWHPNKLEVLLHNIGSNHLIYNDMEIKDEHQNIIADSFWEYRSNHFKNISALFLANTVTGSASLFTSKFLARVLPLPPRIGNSFHDHWMGLVAAMDGKIKYLDKVLQSYIQHEYNVTGYGKFREINMTKSTLSLLSLQRMKASVTLAGELESSKLFVKNNLKVYFDAYLRRKLLYEILLIRFPGTRRKGLDNVYLKNKKAVRSLLNLHWKIYNKGWKTNNAELSYINALEVMKLKRIEF